MRESSKRSSRPTALTVGNYRCFAEPTRMRLAPLTLLYGWNNSGKSALVRMLALLGASVSDSATAPLDLSLFGDRTSFREMCWTDERPSIQVGLEWNDGLDPASVMFDVAFSSNPYGVYVNSVRLQSVDATKSVVQWDVDIPTRSYDRFTRSDRPGAAAEELTFKGLIPPTNEPDLQRLRMKMQDLRDRIQWLEAVRTPPKDPFKPSGRRPRLLKSDGSDAVQALLADDDLLDRVKAFYRECKREFDFQPQGSENMRVMLPPQILPSKDIALADAGAGMTQCLPVVVALAMAERENGPQILAIEEPESHLHPKAQMVLVDFLCQTINTPHKPAVVLETHSRALISAVQLAIAQTRISPNDVCAYWLESDNDGVTRPKEVTFNKKGLPSTDDLLGISWEETKINRDLANIYIKG